MAIGDPYISRQELKETLGITSADEDAVIDRAVRGAGRAIEKRTGWPTFWRGAAPETRTVEVPGRVVPIRRGGACYDKLLLRNGIATPDGFSVPSIPSARIFNVECFAEGEAADSIVVPAGALGSVATLDFISVIGWPDVPADVIWANQMQAQRYYSRKGSPEGVAGSAEWGLSRVPRLDPDVVGVLKDGGYMRAGIG